MEDDLVHIIRLEDQQSSEYFDASPHTSEDEDDEDKSDDMFMGLSDEEDDDGYFDSSEVRDLISSVHNYVSMQESPSARESDRYSDLPTISEDVSRELQGQVEFYKTNLMQVESKYTMLLETYQKVDKSNREKEKILKNYLVILQRASLTPEYVIELQETIIKLKGEIGVLQQQLMRKNSVDEEFATKASMSSQREYTSPAVTSDITEYSSPDGAHPDNHGRYYKLEEENKLLKATIEQLRAEVKRLSVESKSNASTNIQITSNIQLDSNISSNLPDTGDRSEMPTLNEDRALRLLLSDSFLDEFTQRIAQKLSVPDPEKMSHKSHPDTPRSRTKTRSTVPPEKVKDTKKRKRLKTPAQRSSRPIRPKSPRPQPKKADVKKTKSQPVEPLSPVRRLSLSDQLEKLKKSYQMQKTEFQAKQKAFEQQKKHMTAKEAKKVELEIRRVKNRLNDRKAELRKLKKLISDPTTDQATAQKV